MMTRLRLGAALACVLLLGCAGPGLIVHERLMAPSLSGPRDPGTAVDTIVVHFTSDVVSDPRQPYGLDRVLEVYRRAGVSAHYLIDREGLVYRLVPEDRVAFHARSWNARSIGIELLAIGSPRDMALYMDPAAYARIPQGHIGYTDAQYAALERLVEAIRGRHPAILHDRRHIVGHEDIDRDRKRDPGELFDWGRIGLSRASDPTQNHEMEY